MDSKQQRIGVIGTGAIGGFYGSVSYTHLPAGRRRPHGVFALDLATGAVRRYLTLPGDGMGNDLAVAPDGTVYLSETRDGSLMRLRPGEPAFQVLPVSYTHLDVYKRQPRRRPPFRTLA